MLRRLLTLGFTAFSLLAACRRGDSSIAHQQAHAQASTAVVSSQSSPRTEASKSNSPSDGERRSNIGFRSRAQFNEHFQKHGAEFGRITQQQYLREAQALRDAPVGGNIEEIRRDDGTTSRFDRGTGAFIAFNRDGTIRTFFKPNDGDAYFRRQASRVH